MGLTQSPQAEGVSAPASCKENGIRGRRIWLSGGAGGVGKHVCKALLSRDVGALSIADIVSEEKGDALCKSLTTGTKSSMHYFSCDVRDAAQVESCMRAARRAMGGLDIVINNAGIVDENSFGRTLGVNVGGAVNGTEAALRLRVPRVVNVSSAAGVFALPAGPYYAASKHAVVGYSRSIGQRVRGEASVCCVCPGFIDVGIGIGRGWGEEAGVMKVKQFVDFFVEVVGGGFGAGRVFYISQQLGGREVRTDVSRRFPAAKL